MKNDDNQIPLPRFSPPSFPRAVPGLGAVASLGGGCRAPPAPVGVNRGSFPPPRGRGRFAGTALLCHPPQRSAQHPQPRSSPRVPAALSAARSSPHERAPARPRPPRRERARRPAPCPRPRRAGPFCLPVTFRWFAVSRRRRSSEVGPLRSAPPAAIPRSPPVGRALTPLFSLSLFLSVCFFSRRALGAAAAPGGLNDCSAGMLGSNLKSLPDVELGEEGAAELRGFRRGPDGGGAVMPKRAKAAAAAAGGPRGAELRVFKASSAEGRLPAGSNLRKQKSLTNLAFLTDAEKKRQLYEPRWSDDMAKGTATTAVAAGGRGGGGGPRGREAPAMSRSLSRSEHSLLPPRPAGPQKPPPAAGKPSRIPRGPYAEVKPLSKAPEAGGGGGGGGGKCDDELLGGKGPAAAGAEEKAYLKVDPELVVTVLGDLEQLLFSQMLGECRPSPRSQPPVRPRGRCGA